MTKFKLFLFICSVTANFISAQDKDTSIYFPQEQLILAECSDAEDKNTCLINYINSLLTVKLQEKKSLKAISKHKKDTLYISARLVFSKDGTLNKEKSNAGISGKKLKKELETTIENLFFNLEFTEIVHQKTPPLTSNHHFNFKYYIQKNGAQTSLKLIPNKDKYDGGEIEKFPVFPGCENLQDKEARICFNKQIQAHITRNFRYPVRAQKMKLQGKVSILFKINKEGEVSNIRTRGPFKTLEEEAIRIIKLIPKCQPGQVNGETKATPYSIPITFKLH